MKTGYRALANAIVLQAVRDYRYDKGSREKAQIIRFFRSPWFKRLTDIDSEYLIHRLKSEEVKKHDS